VRGSRARTSGTGLGLTIVKRIVTDHAGQFGLSSEVGLGTRATLDLPIYG
jgi:signal transduction histidine kinase